MQSVVLELKHSGKTIGFAPTMGYLHQGHLSLVSIAKQESGVSVCSIYVNPTQFAPTEDLSSYPRDLKRDLELLESVGTDFVFTPSTEDIYPAGYSTYVSVENITSVLEGASRPTHFRGVTTIVSLLFNILLPDVAVFGQKDAQQAAVLQKMVHDLRFPIKMIIAPIVRELDGLAMSSRNVYLSPEQRKNALVLSQALKNTKNLVEEGERDFSKISKMIIPLFEDTPEASLDYFSAVEKHTFEKADIFEYGHAYYILVACKIGRTRLIDNLLISL